GVVVKQVLIVRARAGAQRAGTGAAHTRGAGGQAAHARLLLRVARINRTGNGLHHTGSYRRGGGGDGDGGGERVFGRDGRGRRAGHRCAGRRDRGRGRGAVRELEAGDACLPIAVAGGGVVFLGIPEGAVIYRIYLHGAVVAPAGRAGLRDSAGDNCAFPLRHGVGGVRYQAAGIANAGEGSTARHTI